MNKEVSISIFAIGVGLILYGVSAANSFSSDVSRFFMGTPTDKTIALLCAGAVFTTLGGYGMSRRSR